MHQPPTAIEALEAWKTVLRYINANCLEKGYMGATIKSVSNTLAERALKEDVNPANFKQELMS